MVKKKAVSSPLLFFKPLNSITYVSENDITDISPESIKVEIVGEKAYGLSCMPKAWTLPFIVISDKLLTDYSSYSASDKTELFNIWSERIIQAATSVGIVDNIIVRSSGYSEGMDERGKFYSVEGMLLELFTPLNNCLSKLSQDKSLNQQKIPLIIQQHVIPISAKGHLSNERRCYKENRDWLGEFEDISTPISSSANFEINLRNWRKKIETENYVEKPLLCNLSVHVSEVLKVPATWAYERKTRLHYEWVWDGNAIYIVQADEERVSEGIDPTKIYQLKSNVPASFTPKCLKELDMDHAVKYAKINNVFVYNKLGLPITKLYILDDQKIIKNMALGDIPIDLEEDIQELVKGSLVIRVDIASKDESKRQLLPRTQEERDLTSALIWLREKSAKLKNELQEELVFIFHNFLPAVSSAFAYAAPGQRKVQIEALWGLPEGLYYNAHDKYIVDTQNPRVNDLNVDFFEIFPKPKYKHFFISPDNDGRWTPKILKPPYDWKGSIEKEEWIKEIALESRRISEFEGKPLSIMWFVNVLNDSGEKIFPWYHEHYNPAVTSRARSYRTKTPFDKSVIVRTKNDIEELKREATKPQSSIRRIRIQPCEDELLRDKQTLHDIGEIAKRMDAIILLEGGVLSHAYYQLMQTHAVVEVLHPFEDFEDKREFNKLVRDKVSLNIEQGGEVVFNTQLSGEYLLRALREKLIEEAFEVLDAIDQESIIGELADVSEVIDGILAHINVSRSELEQRQKQKREKAGGFKEGIVLLETRNPLPTKQEFEDRTLFEGILSNDQQLDERVIMAQSHKIDKWTDKREHKTATEAIMRLTVPMIRDNWVANTYEKHTDSDPASNVKVQISGSRLGSKYQIELSVFTKSKQYEQLLLKFEDADDK